MSIKLRYKRSEKGLAAEKPKAPHHRKILPTTKVESKPKSGIQVSEVTHPRGIDAQRVTYDESLFERASTQWQFGDWEGLAALNQDTLQHHPDRAELALLAAAGNMQINNAGKARQFIRLAQDWGCSKKLVSQILIAGVHNTLGRAAALMGQQPRALRHFERAIAIGAPGSEVRLISQARASKQLTQIGQPGENTTPQLAGNSMAMAFAAAPQAPIIFAALQKQNAELSAQIKKHSEDLNKLKQSFEKTIKFEMTNATKQLEAFLGVQNYLATGELTGEMHVWPISPDFAMYLIQLLEKHDYDLVIEFGSGTSTVLIAKTLAKIASRRKGKPKAIQIAFEHLEQFHSKTLDDLSRAQLDAKVQLVLAPLAPYTAPNGTAYPYYRCQAHLKDIAGRCDHPKRRVLVLVDGPPESTGKHARYPAVPIVMADFHESSLDILLDDHNRLDEKEVAKLWISDLTHGNRHADVTEIPLEKGAILLRSSRAHV